MELLWTTSGPLKAQREVSLLVASKGVGQGRGSLHSPRSVVVPLAGLWQLSTQAVTSLWQLQFKGTRKRDLAQSQLHPVRGDHRPQPRQVFVGKTATAMHHRHTDIVAKRHLREVRAPKLT